MYTRAQLLADFETLAGASGTDEMLRASERIRLYVVALEGATRDLLSAEDGMPRPERLEPRGAARRSAAKKHGRARRAAIQRLKELVQTLE